MRHTAGQSTTTTNPKGTTMTDNNQAGMTSDFPILDGFRPPNENGTCDRSIIDVFGFIEPFLDETDGWVAVPLRLVHSAGAGFSIEMGPYTLDAADILKMAEAITAYRSAIGR